MLALNFWIRIMINNSISIDTKKNPAFSEKNQVENWICLNTVIKKFKNVLSVFI